MREGRAVSWLSNILCTRRSRSWGSDGNSILKASFVCVVARASRWKWGGGLRVSRARRMADSRWVESHAAAFTRRFGLEVSVKRIITSCAAVRRPRRGAPLPPREVGRGPAPR